MKNYIRTLNFYFFSKSLKKALKNNKQFTIISNNCIAGIIYHNLQMKFNSPTINLYIKGRDYLSFVKNIKFYTKCELKDITYSEQNANCPVGLLVGDDKHDDIKVYFLHYINFDQASRAWMKRCKRIIYDNIYYIWDFPKGLYEKNLIKEFDELPIKKVCLLHEKIDGLKNSYTFSFYNNTNNENAFNYISKYSAKRFIDEWNYVDFLNN